MLLFKPSTKGIETQSGIAFGDVNSNHRLMTWKILIAGFIMIDLLWAGWNLNPAVDASLYMPLIGENNKQGEIYENGRVYMHPVDEYQIKYVQYFNFTDFNAVEDWHKLRKELLPNVNILDHIRSANNYDPILPDRYTIGMDILASNITSKSVGLVEKMMNLSNIRRVNGVYLV